MNFASFVSWLSKRFPEQLTVSVAEWTELREEVGAYNVLYQNQEKILEKLVSLEKRLAQLEASQGFINGASGKGSFKLER